MKESSKAGVIVAVAALSLLVGGGAGYAIASATTMKDTQTTSMTQTVETPATGTELRVTLNNLLREHVSSSVEVTRAIVSDAPQNELDGALAAQTANAGDIAAAVGSIYGQEAQDQITTQFVEHIVASNDYARAVAAGDENAKMMAQQELDEYLTKISAFFSGAIPTLPQEAVFDLLSEHESLINQSVEAYAAANFERSYELEREALMQVDGIAEALANGIVETQPDKF